MTDERTLIASTRRRMGTTEDSTGPVPEVGVPEEVRLLLEQHPRPWQRMNDAGGIIDADGVIVWLSDPETVLLAVQAVNAFDVDRQWKPSG